jgi:hypothetical protein
MIEVAAAYATAQAAVAGVKAAVSLYKDAKAVGKDVSGIIGEISSHLGSFFEAQEEVVKSSHQTSLNPIKQKSLDAQALDNVIKIRQLQQYEVELRELLIYHTPMAGVWDDFQLERKRLRDVKAEEEAEERRLAAKARKLRREFEEKVVLYGVIAGSVVFLVSVVSYMFYLIAEHARS